VKNPRLITLLITLASIASFLAKVGFSTRGCHEGI